MLQIRKKQMDELSRACTKEFEDRMVVHIAKFFPKHYEALGEEKTRTLINYGIERAKTYGIVAERDVCKYIDLMVGFGPDYDRDPKKPWAGKTLNDQTIKDPSVKINAVYDAGLEHLRQSPEFARG